MLKTKDVLNYLVETYDSRVVMFRREKGINSFAHFLTEILDCSFYCARKAVIEYPYYLEELCDDLYEYE